MPVIKASSAQEIANGAVVLDLSDLKRQGEAILAAARAEAERLLDEASEEAARRIDGAAEIGRARGHDEGLAAGREEGLEQGRRDAIEALRPELDALRSSWSDALERWEQERGDMLVDARRDVLDLAVAVAERVVHRTVRLDPTVVESQLAAALDQVARRTAVVVAVHPDDRALLQESSPDLVADHDGRRHVAFEVDPAMARGGCRLATADGRVDASLATQLDRIVLTLLPGPRLPLDPEAGAPPSERAERDDAVTAPDDAPPSPSADDAEPSDPPLDGRDA